MACPFIDGKARALEDEVRSGVIRVAVVTGGSSGFGAALARRLSAEGWRCVLLARGRERLGGLAAEVGAEAEVCDVADRADVERAAAAVAERHEAVHLLVNNAGVPGRGGFLSLSAERIEELVRINYLGGVWCLRAFLPLLERGAPADVVNVASVAGTVAVGPSGPYSASKHAQLAFSRNVAAELAPRGIRVHSVVPGFAETAGFPQAKLSRRRLTRHLVMRPERVADAIVRSVERGRTETFVPQGYRLAAALQGVAPGTLTRLAVARARRR
jgi:NAD(P)-dependent dehydrogenase (short-subunit alcohol dehydrogenase family)